MTKWLFDLAYSPELIASLTHESQALQGEFDRLLGRAVQTGQSLDVRAREYMLHGVGRRLKLLGRCVRNVFHLFPPSRTIPLASDDLDEVQISLHAFVMNLYGLFENLAWAFVLRHDLEKKLGDRRRIGMFLSTTQQYLPKPLKNYLTSETLLKWHKNYLKNYRDALAHRIPLYIPPATYGPEQAQEYETLNQSEWDYIYSHKWDELEQLRDRMNALGSACPMFVHSFGDEAGGKPIYLHPQMICDGKTVVEFCDLYFTHWHESNKIGVRE